TAIVVLILSTILFSCASRKNKRASKELKSPTVEVVQENKEIPQQEGSIIAVTSAPKQEEPVAQEKPKPIEKKAVVEAPLRVDLPVVQREFRAAWIATVANINWPTKGNYSTEAQKQEAIKLLD